MDEEYWFDFAVTGLTEDEATELMVAIVGWVERLGGYVGGGFGRVRDEASSAAEEGIDEQAE